jgi:hypothetical protein
MRRASVVLWMLGMTALEAAPRRPWGQLVQRAEDAAELPRASLVCKVRVGAITEEDVGSPNGTRCEMTCEVISTLKGETGKEVRIRFRRHGNGPVRPGLNALKAGEVHLMMLSGEAAPYEAYAAMRAVDAVVEPTYGKRPGDRLLAELVAMCRSDIAAMRTSAIDQIGIMRDTRAKEEVDAAARSDDAELARAGLTAQYRMGIAPDINRVMELFDDLMLDAWYQESGIPRRDAAENVLWREQGGLRILERGVPDFDYATFLREGIRKEWIRADDHKLYLFFGVPWKVQRKECVPELIKLLADPKRRVRWLAASCLTNTVLNKQGPDYEHFAKQEEAELETWHLWWKEEGPAFMGEAEK